jgi:hypothetical protein
MKWKVIGEEGDTLCREKEGPRLRLLVLLMGMCENDARMV